jgi:hypothetical protein
MRKKRKQELKSRSPVLHRDYTKHTRCAFDGCVRYARKNSAYCYICGGVVRELIPLTPEEINEMEREMGRIALNHPAFLHSLMTEAPFGLTPVDYRAARAQEIGITPEEKEE